MITDFGIGPRPLDLDRRGGGQGDGHRLEHWSFTGWAGDLVQADLAVPAGPAWGLIMVGHGALGSRSAPYVQGPAKAWAREGLAVIAADAPLHGDRMPSGGFDVLEVGRPGTYRQAVGDLLRLEAVVCQTEFAALPRGLLGFSMGGLAGVPFLVYSEAVGAAVLMISGSTEVMSEDAYPEWAADGIGATRSTDPTTYAPLVRRGSVLLMGAEHDEVFNPRSVRALYDAFRIDKRLVFFPGTHAVWSDPAARFRTMLEFFSEQLRPNP